MSTENKTEQATPRRRQKARQKGQIARSRELPSALAALGAVLFLGWQMSGSVAGWRTLMAQSLDLSVSSDLGFDAPLLTWTEWAVVRWAGPALLLAWAVSVAASVAQGGLVFAGNSLVPDVQHLNPATRLRQLFSISSIANLLKSLVPAAAIVYFSVAVLQRDLSQLASASHRGGLSLLGLLASRIFEIAWKSGLAMLAWAGIDYLLQREKLERDLRMSKQEIRDEVKETEGNPFVKARIRRLQRQVRRKRMLEAVPQATVVVTNPQEFAVALQYTAEMGAPMVIAKGRNLLAREIKRRALWHAIPLVENPPLAHALYRMVEIGQSIPAKLYAVVAEILAVIYRAQAAEARKHA